MEDMERIFDILDSDFLGGILAMGNRQGAGNVYEMSGGILPPDGPLFHRDRSNGRRPI